MNIPAGYRSTNVHRYDPDTIDTIHLIWANRWHINRDLYVWSDTHTPLFAAYCALAVLFIVLCEYVYRRVTAA